MGGGDGKVDTKTYPVAGAVSDGRWIAAPRGDDRWAFAFSAMKDWKRKVRSDVVKIAETDRGYSRRNSEHERRLSRVAHLSARRSGQGGAHQRLVEAGSVVLTSAMGAAATPPNSGRSEGRRRVMSGHTRLALPCSSALNDHSTKARPGLGAIAVQRRGGDNPIAFSDAFWSVRNLCIAGPHALPRGLMPTVRW